ncbi:signal peptidase I [Janibacter limosus]|uniref:Signal peptidase I n=1 Tax=Janibacter limosus TaxID=53458 RepID=A0AC61U723_9MICO|nr:signal peptidase I [Janibacter limosus]UUZ45713.1 signal peptidase I [Janibacter limosus]
MAHDPDSAHAEAEDSHKDRVREERVRDERGVGARLGGAVRETVVVLAMALTLSFVVKTFLIRAFFIPSESMQNTLLVGDRVVVSKLTPGPFELKRGDIVVFADPGDWLSPTPVTNRGAVLNGLRDAMMFVGLLPDTSEGHLIKRVIGMPGDHVQCCDAEGRLLVNGEPIEESAYLKPGVNPSDMEFDITVPSGRMWVMGDNRSDSSDSRYHDPGGTGSDGSVPLDLVVGKAVVTVWPFDRAGRLSTHEDVFSRVPDAGSNRSLGLPVREPHSS